jgi:hypothetical protein
MSRILFLLFLFSIAQVNGYWIVAQVKEINWQQQCIQDRNCDAMELSLVLDSNSETGSAQSAWKLENVLKNASVEFLKLLNFRFLAGKIKIACSLDRGATHKHHT